MARNTERVINTLPAQALLRRHPRWSEGAVLVVEATEVLLGAPAAQPDILIAHPGGAPVIVETEVAPARTVENDARRRLGRYLVSTDDVIENAVAVRMPGELRIAEGDPGGIDDLPCFPTNRLHTARSAVSLRLSWSFTGG